MALDFPASPTTGQTYSPGTGMTWQYDGTKWVTAGGASVTIGATPPVSPPTGTMWWDNIGGQLYIYYNDGNSSQWVSASAMNTGQSTPPIVAPPITASWTNRNFSGSTTKADVANGIALFDSSVAGITHTLVGLSVVAPSAPYTIDASFSIAGIVPTGGYLDVAMGWTDGTKAQVLEMLAPLTSTNMVQSWQVSTYSAFATYVAAVGSLYYSIMSSNNMWLRIADNGTIVSFALSSDGVSFVTVYSVAKSSGYLGTSGYANALFGINSGALGNGGSQNLTLKSWWVH